MAGAKRLPSSLVQTTSSRGAWSERRAHADYAESPARPGRPTRRRTDRPEAGCPDGCRKPRAPGSCHGPRVARTDCPLHRDDSDSQGLDPLPKLKSTGDVFLGKSKATAPSIRRGADCRHVHQRAPEPLAINVDPRRCGCRWLHHDLRRYAGRSLSTFYAINKKFMFIIML